MNRSRTSLVDFLVSVAIGTVVTPSISHSQCAPTMTFTGEAAYDYFGQSVSGVGDVDNDGYADLIVGAMQIDAGGGHEGRAYVYSGQSGGLLFTFTGEATEDHFGNSVSGAGDVDNDGYADVIVGAYWNDAGGSNAGRAYVYLGQTGALLYTFTGEAADDWFGKSVSEAGDVDNDGHADLIVGAYGNDAGGSDAGRAYVYSGQSGALLYTFTGEAADDWFGYSVSGAGDVDNDGFADLIIGARLNDAGGNKAGRAYVYSGQSGTLLHTFTGEAAEDELGRSVSGAEDVDNDGYADLIVGAWLNDAGGNKAGRAYVYSGQSGAILHTFTGEAADNFFGISVSGAKDANNDGYADLIVGASLGGQAYVYSGQSGTLLHTFSGEAAGDFFGGSVSWAGDIDNDGNVDMIAGAHRYSKGIPGRAYVYSLAPCGVGVDDTMASMGLFRILVDSAFQPMMVDYPGYDFFTSKLTSDVLIDLNTVIGRSLGHLDSDASDVGGVPVGTDGTVISDADFSVVPGGFQGPAGVQELHTEVRSLLLQMASGLGPTVRAGVAAPGRPISPGEVEGQDPTGATILPGESFFDVFVEVDLPAGGNFPFPGGTLYNELPILVADDTIWSLPPKVVYLDGNPEAVKVYFLNADPGGGWSAGDFFGWLVLVGHGVNFEDEPAFPSGRQQLGDLALFMSVMESTSDNCCFVAGDANNNSTMNIADAIFIINRIFNDGTAPVCSDQADANGNNSFNIADAIHIINTIFNDGASPVCGTTRM